MRLFRKRNFRCCLPLVVAGGLCVNLPISPAAFCILNMPPAQKLKMTDGGISAAKLHVDGPGGFGGV